MMDLLIGDRWSVSVDNFFPAKHKDIDNLMNWSKAEDEEKFLQVVEYLQEKIEGLEDNIKYIQERLNDGYH